MDEAPEGRPQGRWTRPLLCTGGMGSPSPLQPTTPAKRIGALTIAGVLKEESLPLLKSRFASARGHVRGGSVVSVYVFLVGSLVHLG